MSPDPVRDPISTAMPPVVDLSAPETDHVLGRRFFLHINLVFVAALVGNTLGFFVAILLARALGPEGRGAAALYQAAVSLGFAFLNMGISAAAFYYVARQEMTARQAMEAGLSISLLAAAVGAIAVAITALFFQGRLEGRDIPYALAIITVPTVIQLRLAEGLLRARGRFTAMNSLELALPLSMLACLGGVELASGLTVSSAVWAWSLAYIPPLVLAYGLLGPGAWPRSPAPLSLLVKTVKFGGQGQITNLIQLLNSRLDVFLILVFVNTSGVGLYTVASSQTEGLWIIANSVGIVLLTSITPADDARAAGATPQVCRNTMLVTGVGAAGAAVIAWLWIPVVFGDSYRASVVPYLLLLPGTVAIAGSKILGSYVFSRGRPIINAWIALATLLATIPTDILLISLLGVPGAALGTTLGYFLTLALSALAYRTLSGRPVAPALLPQREDLGLYRSAAAAALRRVRALRATGGAP